jgi:hypothetical protein
MHQPGRQQVKLVGAARHLSGYPVSFGSQTVSRRLRPARVSFLALSSGSL